jgi:magnesium-transporting ATPase (P-type)
MDFRKYLPNKQAFAQLLVGSILAVMIGATLLVISYTVINAVFLSSSPSVAAGMGTNSSLNASLWGNLSNITAALNITGISLIVIGISGIIYMLIGLGGVGSGRK